MGSVSKEITKKFKINGTTIYQPDKDMSYNYQTTYSEGSKRNQFGKALLTPLFTVEQYGYKATNIPVEEASKIIKAIIKGKPFTLYHWSLYHLSWRSDSFYVGKGQCTIGEISDDRKYLSELSFNMEGVNPLD